MASLEQSLRQIDLRVTFERRWATDVLDMLSINHLIPGSYTSIG